MKQMTVSMSGSRCCVGHKMTSMSLGITQSVSSKNSGLMCSAEVVKLALLHGPKIWSSVLHEDATVCNGLIVDVADCHNLNVL